MHGSDAWHAKHPDRLPKRAGSIQVPICYDGRGNPLTWATEYTYECGHRLRYTDPSNGQVCLMCELNERARKQADIAARGVGTYQI